MSSKTVVGHSHTPQIAKGVYAMGSTTNANWNNILAVGSTAKYQINYNGGPAVWQTGSVIIYASGCVVACPDPVPDHPLPRRREAIEHTRRKLGL